MQISQSHIDVYKSLFRGREDVYAVRREKDGRSGYMPAYKIDWDDYNRHKASEGNFAIRRKLLFPCFINWRKQPWDWLKQAIKFWNYHRNLKMNIWVKMKK